MNTQKRPNEIPIVLVEMASAFIAGSMSKTIVAPLERVKLILQNQPLIHVPEKYKYKGIMDALRSNTSIIIETKLVGIPVDQGFFSFWRGNGTNILRIIPSSIIRFSSYETINRMFVPHKGLRQNKFNTALHKLGAATVSGFITIAFTYPLDLARTRLSVDVSKYNEPRKYQGTFGCMRTTVKNEGLLGLYKGFWISCLGIVPYLGLSLGTYDILKPFLFDKKTDGSESLITMFISSLGAGTIAGMTAQIVTYPLDTVRRRMQLNGGHGLEKAYLNSFDCIKKIALQEGVRGFFKGMVPNLVKIPPAAAIQFSMYDLMKQQIEAQSY